MSTAAGPRRAGAARRAEQRSDSDTSPSEVPCFRLESPETSVLAYGVAHRLVETIPDLPGPELLARMGPHGADVLVGALPFDPERGASLIRPRRWWRGREGPGTLEKGAPVVAPGSECTVRPVPTRDGYAEIVGQALEEIDAVSGGSAWLGKVVLARELHVEAEAPFAPEAILAALRDGRATTFLVDLPPSESGASRTLVGASPELLVHKRGTLVSSTPLAGSAPRHEDPEQDRLAAERLRASAKDLREHRVVVDHVRDTLEPYCRTLHVDETPRLTSTGAMWHLATHVRGTLRDPAICALELARALHPTPAVCGVPADRARAAIRRLEPFDRGFYAGAVGWVDAVGDGSWMVTIRCAEITGRRAVLRAGAGIVTGSNPRAEAAETSAKFVTMLSALGIDECGKPLRPDVGR